MSITNLLNETSIASGNTHYYDYRDRWEYLLQSYVGGEAYRDGGHLQRYQLETSAEYSARLASAHLDNHCNSVVSVYNSFLFRKAPYRDLGTLEGAPGIDDFMRDVDVDGTSMDNFMKQVATWSSVFGNAWIVVSKPDVGALTLADELGAGVRPYLSLLTPLNVIDWQYSRASNGAYELTYFKYLEEFVHGMQVIKEWTKDTITTYKVEEDSGDTEIIESVDNGLGIIPAVCAYNKKTSIRGIGMGDINDIADAQRFIYSITNELEQTIRLDSHPSLVCTPETITGNGAGSIIQIPESMDPALKPYLLQYGGASAASIMGAISATVASIDKMANIGSIRSTEGARMSGVAQQQEFELLNARLSEKADNLELAEEQIFKLVAAYQGTTWTGNIAYADSFNIRDVEGEVTQLKIASESAADPRVQALIDRSLVELLGYEPDLVLEEPAFEPHVMISPEGERVIANTMAEHLALQAQGYTHLDT